MLEKNVVGFGVEGGAEGVEGPLLSTKQVAAMLGFAKGTLEKWRDKGIGPEFMKIGRSVRYRVKAIQQWLDLQEESRH